MLSDLELKAFLAKTASGSPVPGGGSIAALSASISASLIEMVANLTIGKKGYEKTEEKMTDMADKAYRYREKFVTDIDRDADAYQQVLAAYGLPSASEDEKAIRKKSIQKALKGACLVPLGVATDTFKLMEMAKAIVEEGNKNALTDGAVAVMMAKTAVLAAIYNVKINLISIKDEAFINKIRKQIVHLEKETIHLERDILSKVEL